MTTNIYVLVPVLIGFIGILQGALNRVMTQDIGLTWMALLGNFVTLVVCIGFYFFAKANPEFFPDFVRLKEFQFKWWYVIPGIFGFLFVVGLPIGIYQVGAVKTTVGLIAAQMVTSVMWDLFIENIPMTVPKGLGVLMAIASVLLITLF
ncbi:PF04657 family protein [Halobacteriovorax sp. BALOs_7]|uniref:DMT family transporter n=1 Tax=Halobacteriovorax sp. BALOs_7 TaxID=2109558 RepID=UPI000EA2B9B8|nr:DMT family transporter [Halobacteriovorax sp. BALOs_7]AYF44097.1 PF04657 family protein [Halobacteriovorax sp. BALOs_7]